MPQSCEYGACPILALRDSLNILRSSRQIQEQTLEMTLDDTIAAQINARINDIGATIRVTEQTMAQTKCRLCEWA